MPDTGKRSLEMTFTTAGGSTARITVNNPIDPVPAALVKSVMETIIAKNVFLTPSGPLTGIKEARVVDQTTEEITLT
jgi:hypothetical protein